VIGLGLSAIYPITIALLSYTFGAAATRLGSVMFALPGRRSIHPVVGGFFVDSDVEFEVGIEVPFGGGSRDAGTLLKGLGEDAGEQ